ncbi:MAG: hypothetical protein KGI60_04070 [Patescibacteria group bacterium]|nr:hypothetical protein [Patescibacteria group bacterium]
MERRKRRTKRQLMDDAFLEWMVLRGGDFEKYMIHFGAKGGLTISGTDEATARKIRNEILYIRWCLEKNQVIWEKRVIEAGKLGG